jgi:hypothetical protein
MKVGLFFLVFSAAAIFSFKSITIAFGQKTDLVVTFRQGGKNPTTVRFYNAFKPGTTRGRFVNGNKEGIREFWTWMCDKNEP